MRLLGYKNRGIRWSAAILLSLLFGFRSLAEVPGPQASTASDVEVLALFENHCMICHGPSHRASPREALARLGAEAIYRTISTGSMKAQAAVLSDAQRRAISQLLGAGGQTEAVPAASACDAAAPVFADSTQGVVWRGWSPDVENTRFQPADVAGLSVDQVTRLKPQWALTFPNLSTLANQVTIHGEWLFLAARDGTIYALDRRSGCAYWTFKAETLVRTAIRIEGQSVFFGDGAGTMYALDGATGTLRWKRRIDDHPAARITGAPTSHDGLLYVGVSSHEESAAAAASYVCCTFRGSVVALDAQTGKEVWKTFTIANEATVQGVNRQGVERRGPSGAPVWSAPTVDTERGLIYVGTGNNYSDPVTTTADAVLALEMRTGAIRWHKALTPSDAWNAACVLDGSGGNCPESEGEDHDIGSSPVLVRRSGGRDVLLVGQKSGVMYALDPARSGELIWERRLGKGGATGGILWGLATDGERAYAAILDMNIQAQHADGSLNAVDLDTGEVVWRTANPPDACQGRPNGCHTGMAAPVTAMPGVVFAGSLDGHLRAYDPASGKILWDFDMVREFTGPSGAVGRGGSISYAGATVAHGYVYQTSGYSTYGAGMAGNVFVAFAPADRQPAASDR